MSSFWADFHEIMKPIQIPGFKRFNPNHQMGQYFIDRGTFILVYCNNGNAPALIHLPLPSTSSNQAPFLSMIFSSCTTQVSGAQRSCQNNLQRKLSQTQTDGQTDGTENITSSANVGGKKFHFNATLGANWPTRLGGRVPQVKE